MLEKRHELYNESVYVRSTGSNILLPNSVKLGQPSQPQEQSNALMHSHLCPHPHPPLFLSLIPFSVL